MPATTLPIAAVPVAPPTVSPVSPALGAPAAEGFTIDCADCVHQHTSVCDDCVVSFIVGRSSDDAVVIDADEARAVRLLEQAGLVPGSRHARKVG
ncbi:MAG: hypothetical protein QOJ44_2140 [Acidimicrobiaceae bacterium]|nr:hypothetical protein [Acidimicrobiaceae bacterium]